MSNRVVLFRKLFSKLKKELYVFWNKQDTSRLVFDSIAEIILLVNANGLVIDCNEKACKYLNINKKNSSNIYSLLSGTAIPVFRSKIEEVIRLGILQVSNIEYNKEHWEVSFTPCGFLFGKIVSVAITMKNSTERVKIQNELILSEKKFKVAFKTSPDAVSLNRLSDGLYMEVNEGFEKLSGYPEQELLGKSSLELSIWYNSDDRRRLIEGLKETGSVRNLEAIFQRKNGSLLIGLMSASIITVNEEPCILNITRDVTEEKRVQNELMESESRYRLLAENVDDVIWIFNIDLKAFTYMSPSVYKLSGYTVEEAMHRSIFKVITPEYHSLITNDLPRRIFEFENGNLSVETRILEIKQFCKDETIIPVEIATKLLTNNNGKVKELLGISRNISGRKQTEQELIEARNKAMESDTLKSAFLANMSHEIRTPMNSIIGFADLLLNPALADEKRLRYADIINVNGRMLLSIINDIIDISKIESGQVVVHECKTCISSIFEEIYSIFKESKYKKKNVALKIITQEAFVSENITADELKIKQILINLVGNALKFTDTGFVEFGCNLDTISDHEMLHFYVRDTGIGINKLEHSLVFDRFRQAEKDNTRLNSGTGLGLPISKAFVEMLGGSIWLESSPGEGSVFHFTIPYKPLNKNKTKHAEKSEQQEYDWSHYSILVVEDEVSNLEYLLEIFNPTCINVTHAATGVDAVEQCKNNKEFHLILMDIKLPDISGLEVTREIKKIVPQIPIIAQTAFAFSDDKDNALKAGCDDYISKPIRKKELLQKISAFLTPVSH